MKRVWFLVVVVLIAAAYVAGFWPVHQRLSETEARLRVVQEQLVTANAGVRLGEVLGRLLQLSDAVSARNYGEATTLSSAYFDRVREEASREERLAPKDALDRLLRARDQVTTAIARSDPSLPSMLRDQALALRQALGYPLESPPADQPGK